VSVLGEDLHARALVAAVTDHKLTGVLHHSNLGQRENILCDPFRFDKTNIGNDWVAVGICLDQHSAELLASDTAATDKTAFKFIEREQC
jgi:hypothetical protein